MRTFGIVAGAIALVVAVVAAIIVWFPSEKARRHVPPPAPAAKTSAGDLGASPPEEVTKAPAASLPPAPPPQGVRMEFARDGVAGKVLQAVERVVRPGRAQVAMHERDGGRWVCIVADSGVRDRYYELDQGLTIDQFPSLREGGFQQPPSHIARTSPSIYRSVTKRAMGYDHARGDRIIILLCPKAEWDALELSWPPMPPE